ncbi:uncharacterized protein ACA1_152880 [Acanthamoeba castellanii str. Neff]|uniref:Uncharacterized protein n=1 Tax=Acanthamoeba castellanii (strain ATCC 30010 / Neff) TaxID=1257118 RepID=L8HF30_ACACF|nr:uncharacterized protein ACA1_152880 [Acanthamoeba castellanii str. Neff]ELR24089.1 hypothetical protein ACA1_152880 [Acanthamoeba castellanii str. Neff]
MRGPSFSNPMIAESVHVLSEAGKDCYKQKVSLSDDQFRYQHSDRLKHPCNLKRFQQCKRYSYKAI